MKRALIQNMVIQMSQRDNILVQWKVALTILGKDYAHPLLFIGNQNCQKNPESHLEYACFL